jgi:hypothetical protein
MVDIIDYTKTFTIALTETPEPSAFPWMLIAALAGGLYLLLKRKK